MLKDFRSNVTSQNGEDGIIAAIFDKIGAINKWCCEFGAWDGVLNSNTNVLIEEGWSGVLIEADRDRFATLRANTKDNPKVKAIQARVRATAPDTLDMLLNQTDIPDDFDLLSIDIDGEDYKVWESLYTYKPRVVIIEVNSSYPPSIERIPYNEGACINKMVQLGRKKGYELVLHTGNAIFVLNEYARLFDLPDRWEDLFDRSWLKHDEPNYRNSDQL